MFCSQESISVLITRRKTRDALKRQVETEKEVQGLHNGSSMTHTFPLDQDLLLKQSTSLTTGHLKGLLALPSSS